jgi:serine/threonine-protein kinase
MERFMREAEILMRIKNEHVVKIIEHNLGKTDESPYIIMEYVNGMSLSGCIKAGKFDINHKISIIQQIAETLECVHRHGVLHRDIKPDNILITDDLFVKITDFGICHVPESSLTMPEQALGSPAYMAPESFETGTKPDTKTDIFSLGVVSYEMLTGIKPFEGDGVCQVVNSLKTKKPAAPTKLNPEIPMWMQDVMAKMLDKNPDKRFSSCGEISKAISHYLSGGGKKQMSLTSRIYRSMITGDSVWS